MDSDIISPKISSNNFKSVIPKLCVAEKIYWVAKKAWMIRLSQNAAWEFIFWLKNRLICNNGFSYKLPCNRIVRHRSLIPPSLITVTFIDDLLLLDKIKVYLLKKFCLVCREFFVSIRVCRGSKILENTDFNDQVTLKIFRVWKVKRICFDKKILR
jgi:hypothetical protein